MELQIKNNILLPKYYNPDISAGLDAYVQSGLYEVKSIAELEKEKIIKVSRGNEVGSENYGTGEIPFVRTSEVSNWEITSDCTHCLAEDIYGQFKDKQKIEPEDILVVNDGTYLMGSTAMITKADTKFMTNHLYTIAEKHFDL